jgi:hypothetical protein
MKDTKSNQELERIRDDFRSTKSTTENREHIPSSSPDSSKHLDRELKNPFYEQNDRKTYMDSNGF